MDTLSKCIKTINLTICNTMLLEHLRPLTKCIDAQMSNKSIQTFCSYKKLEEKYQMIRLTEQSIYLYVTKPIPVRITCGPKINEINVTKTMEINFEKQCKVFRRIHSYTSNSSIVHIKTSYLEPMFSVYENKTWLDVKTFLDQYNIWNLNLYQNFKRTELDFQSRAKIISTHKENFISKIFNSFSNYSNMLLNNTILFILFCTVLLIFIITIIIHCVFCYKK